MENKKKAHNPSLQRFGFAPQNRTAELGVTLLNINHQTFRQG
ncbi:hypothetical protein QUF90_25610 [Desulfococcaceae bacterium HSG9]|nr:hypothetical protein [Desulfococcaceae bacterium HSG9]